MGSSTATYYLYNDHASTLLSTGLGSVTTMSTTGGGTVADSTARYYPFGDWRTEPTASDPNGSPLTDRGFTGHMHNNLGSAPDDIGLIYMNARWYAPALGRFISADTVVPNPMNPQSLNRYSYTRNSPLNFTDPLGHRECGLDGNCDPPPSSKPNSPGNLISFKGANGQTWTDAEMATVNKGANNLANALARTINNNRWGAAKLGVGTYSRISSADAFFAVYGGPVTFYKTGTACAKGCWGERVGAVWGIGESVINTYTQAYDGQGFDITSAYQDGRNYGELWAVHELGHAFNAARSNATDSKVNPYNDLDIAFGEHGALNGYALNPRDGMNPFPWQQHPGSNATNEVFADYFLNWTYNSFLDNDPGRAQYSWMNRHMPNWVP
ncbi:MAG: RHS repeat-associated core domain-containing protein [Ardenticatenaceae bacterium]|nr:RHS repeat-associated core domain-containing protein [Ardenticatenaceae bacterium]